MFFDYDRIELYDEENSEVEGKEEKQNFLLQSRAVYDRMLLLGYQLIALYRFSREGMRETAPWSSG